MSTTKTEFTNVTVWNMNGGPIPNNLAENLARAIEAFIKEAEDRDGVRLLYAFTEVDGS
jgi:hypothetical protein